MISCSRENVFFACLLAYNVGVRLDLSLVGDLSVVTDWCRELRLVCLVGVSNSS